MSESNRKPTKIAEALASYLDRSGIGERIEAVVTVDDWPERVGARIAAVAEPLHMEGAVLFVGVKSSAWLMELRMMESEIRSRLNEGRAKGQIERIRFIQQGGDETPRGPVGWGRKSR